MTNHLRAALVVAGITVAAILLTFAAHADPLCAPFEKAMTNLKDKTGEKPAFIGTLDGGGVFVVVINPATKDYAVLVQPTSENICLEATGQGWEPAPDSVANPPGPSY